jgi:hypothetical protein
MIHLIITDADIRPSGAGGNYHLRHPMNDAILAYCDTQEEAEIARKGINDLALRLSAATNPKRKGFGVAAPTVESPATLAPPVPATRVRAKRTK